MTDLHCDQRLVVDLTIRRDQLDSSPVFFFFSIKKEEAQYNHRVPWVKNLRGQEVKNICLKPFLIVSWYLPEKDPFHLTFGC